MEEQREKKKFWGSLAIPALIVALMLAVKILEDAFDINLGSWGLVPQTAQGLLGILTMPFLHGSWEHLFANSVPILVLGTALYYCYPTLANRVMLVSYLASGVLTWCIGSPHSTHIGASALIYALNLFLIVSGFIRGNRQLIVISLIMVFLYGSFIWGMIPSLAKPQHISWEGHLSGAIVGTVLALALKKEGPQKEVYHWDEEDNEDENDNENDGEPPYWDVPTPSNDQLTVKYHFRH